VVFDLQHLITTVMAPPPGDPRGQRGDATANRTMHCLPQTSPVKPGPRLYPANRLCQ
jgi:hypothetical protein